MSHHSWKMMTTATAFAAVCGATAIAQTAPQTAPQTPPQAAPPAATTPAPAAKVDGKYYTESEMSDFLASKLIGSRVYATTNDFDVNTAMPEASKDWSHIGEINNLVVGKAGAVKAVVLGVGGFLGMGEKDVAVPMSELSFVKRAGDKAGDFFIVVKRSKEALNAAPAYKRS